MGQGRLGDFDERLRLRPISAQRTGSERRHREATPGSLTDHYDPRTRTLRISTGVAHTAGRQSFGSFGGGQTGGGQVSGGPIGAPMGRGYAYGVSTAPGAMQSGSGRLSVAQVAVIAHEVGHAQQHAKGLLMSVRQLIVPVGELGLNPRAVADHHRRVHEASGLAVLGLAFFAGAVEFTFVTLPVEFGASNRALAFVGPLGLTGERGDGARQVLRAAGWTYVAAALTALLTFVDYLSLVTGSRR